LNFKHKTVGEFLLENVSIIQLLDVIAVLLLLNISYVQFPLPVVSIPVPMYGFKMFMYELTGV